MKNIISESLTDKVDSYIEILNLYKESRLKIIKLINRSNILIGDIEYKVFDAYLAGQGAYIDIKSFDNGYYSFELNEESLFNLAEGNAIKMKNVTTEKYVIAKLIKNKL